MSQIDEIKKRHKERRQRFQRYRVSRRVGEQTSSPIQNHTHSNVTGSHPLFRSQTFIIKCLFAAALILLSGLLYKATGAYPQAKNVVHQTLTKDFNFAKVSAWYEGAFGKPLDFLPTYKGGVKKSDKVTNAGNESKLAVPVNGTITKGFSNTQKGVFVKTHSNASVEAIDKGYVVSVGDKNGIGKTIVIQHSDGSQSWYGNLKSVDVKVYDIVKKSQKIGVVSTGSGQQNGSFYFAIKEGDRFVDPIQVISFE